MADGEEQLDRQRRLRRFKARLRHAALTRTPVKLSMGRLGNGKALRQLCVVQRQICLPDLPDPLDGLRIAHVSDLHVGELLRAGEVEKLVEAVNAVEADLVACTGDYVDFSLDVLDETIASLARLQAPLGVYFVPGNHDHLEDGPRLISAFRNANLSMLTDESIRLDHEGCGITVGGIDYHHRPTEVSAALRQTFKSRGKRKTEALRLLLAHHPDTFDAAHGRGVDLVLAGHTHGGQLMLSATRGKKGSIGIGSLAFRYPRGLFQRGGTHLHVTSGVGSWFPLRVRCPAEIACLTLRNTPVSLDGPSQPASPTRTPTAGRKRRRQ